MTASPQPGTNRLLAALPKKEQDRLLPHLKLVTLGFEEVLFERDELIRHVYFPTDGIISLLLELDDGSTAEIGRVGNEGLLGLPVFLGFETSHTRALVQVAGEALRMDARVFSNEARRAGPLANQLLRYTQCFMRQVSQLAACNIRHSIEQRLCRWLLVTHDRVRGDQLEITQEFLSRMLGTHRESITVVARALQERGFIRYSRGKLTIIDPHGLEAASCECYRAVKRIFEPALARA